MTLRPCPGQLLCLWPLLVLAACGTPSAEPDQLAPDAGSLIPDSDAAPVEDDSPSCSREGLAALSPGTNLQVGDFIVDTQDGLHISHRNEPEHLVHASSDRLFAAARSTLHVEEHQGSFSVSEELGTRCTARVISGAAHNDDTLELSGSFEGESPECQDLSFTLRLCEVGQRQLRFEIETSDTSFDRLSLFASSHAEERIYGMGEQVPHSSLNLKGRTIPVLVQEGGVGRGHVPISPAVNAVSPGSAGSEDSSYYVAPHYLTSDNRSLFLENSEYGVFDFSADEEIRIELHAPRLDGRILYGQSPLELIELFTAYAGRMSALPSWVNDGAIVALAQDTQSSMEIIDELLSRGVEIAAVWNQTWSGTAETFIGEQVVWNWISNESEHPDWHSYTSQLAQKGIRTLCYVNPMLRDVSDLEQSFRRNLFQEARDAGYLVRNPQGDAYILEATAFDVGLLDLSNPGARQWMKDVLADELIATGGCDGWMADFAEALPFDAQLHSGEDAASYHNRYPVEWIKLHREALEESGLLGETLVFNRSGHTRSPRYSMLLWQGDQLTTWDRYDGMVSAIRGLIGGGLSGISLNHSDVGGYTSLSRFDLGYKREVSLTKRWTELAAFTAVLRTHEGNQPDINAQVYDDGGAMDHFARMSKIYKALGFYREQLFEQAANRGWPVVRHMMLHYPDDPRAHEQDTQFMLGSELVVAPILNKCWTAPICPYSKRVYLPAGRWVHLWSGDVYDGGADVTVQAPMGSPAVFYKEGSAVGSTFVANLQAAGIELPSAP